MPGRTAVLGVGFQKTSLGRYLNGVVALQKLADLAATITAARGGLGSNL
jgi:hypothetical protein